MKVDNLKKLTCGGEFTLLLTSDGHLQHCGWCPTLEIAKDGRPQTEFTTLLKNPNITTVAAGFLHLMILIGNNEVWGYGHTGSRFNYFER